MNPRAKPWTPHIQPSQHSSDPTYQQQQQQQQYAQNLNPHTTVPNPYDDTWPPWGPSIFGTALPSRDQILGKSSKTPLTPSRQAADTQSSYKANGRILQPGCQLQVLTTIQPITGECFAFLATISQPGSLVVTILYWGRGCRMDVAMAWLQYQVDWELHKRLRVGVRVAEAFYEDAWGGL